MTGQPFGRWIADPSLPAFTPAAHDREMKYWGLRCPCGSTSFRASGRPGMDRGPGGHFWRTLSRVWRDARSTNEGGEPRESPFAFPLFLECAACSLEGEIFAGAEWHLDPSPGRSDGPREAYRCRVCRRSGVEVVVGVAVDASRAKPGADERPAAIEVVARCRACRREARIAWSDARPSDQEVQLDVLYGRR